MKRGTTPTIPITIKMPPDNIEIIEFIFAKEVSEYAKVLLHRKFEGNIPIKKGDNENEFIVELSLDADETMRLQSGDVYMDTRIVLAGGFIPETEIVKTNIGETLFREVYRSD